MNSRYLFEPNENWQEYGFRLDEMFAERRRNASTCLAAEGYS